MKKTVLGLVGILGALSCASKAEDFLVTHETHFKKSMQQSSDLPASDKCLVAEGTLISVESSSQNGTHLKVTTENNLLDCGFTQGYVYTPHVANESHLLTVTANSVFKLRPISSSQLPAQEKCDISPGVYAAQSAIPSTADSHYRINLQKFLPNCHFSEGYLWEGHTQTGALAVQITFDSLLKKSPKDSSDLPESDFCDMPVGLYVLGSGASSSGESHYRVTLAESLENCNFNSGYVYYDHTNWKKPYVAPPKPTFTFPLPSGYYTSGWCKCRNIGTSPHIGQDISRAGTKRAVAVQNGRMDSTTFSSSCGYISYVEDDFGTLWRYVHLNSPSVSPGKRVTQGQHLAYISRYPKSGCGSGAHLHFERRSAGYFNDSSTGKTCQNGYRSCYYDPIKPWRSSFSSQVAQKQPSSKSTNWSTLTKPKSQSCKIRVEAMPEVAQKRFNQYPTLENKQLIVEFNPIKANQSFEYFDANVSFKDNPSNTCNEKKCITQWQLVSESNSGQLKSVFFHNRVRNIPLVREAEEKHCIPADTNRRWLLLKDNEGEQWKVEI